MKNPQPLGPYVHGLRHKPVYESWRGMKKRCLCTNHEAYHNYGGRGIEICVFLLKSPVSIIELIGDRPKGMSLDRRDNNGNYSCGQCSECIENGWGMNLRWATASEQGRNTRHNRVVEINGEKHLACEWADILGIDRELFYNRLYRGETGINLIGPLRRKRKKKEK